MLWDASARETVMYDKVKAFVHISMSLGGKNGPLMNPSARVFDEYFTRLWKPKVLSCVTVYCRVDLDHCGSKPVLDECIHGNPNPQSTKRAIPLVNV